MRARSSKRNVESFPGVQWRRCKVTLAHDRLPDPVEAVFHMRQFPPFGELDACARAMVVVGGCTVKRLGDFHANGVDAVKRVKNVWPTQ